MKKRSPLVVVVGPTASGKSALALRVAEAFQGEIVSCDSVAVFRGMDIGSAKPSTVDRSRVPHHGLDLLDPDQPSTAGDYAREARRVFGEITQRHRLPVVAGGTGLYLRATLDGLAPAPPRDEALRHRLRAFAARRGAGALHRLLSRFDPTASQAVHRNDEPKLIRSLEVALLTRRPQTEQWLAGRDTLHGYRILQIGLQPLRALLYERINKRAAGMFEQGLVEETANLVDRFGEGAHALGALGYVQALGVLQGRLTFADAIAAAQQGHRNYAKRQMTWFRRDKRVHWIQGLGDEAGVQALALDLIAKHLKGQPAAEEQTEA